MLKFVYEICTALLILRESVTDVRVAMSPTASAVAVCVSRALHIHAHASFSRIYNRCMEAVDAHTDASLSPFCVPPDALTLTRGFKQPLPGAKMFTHNKKNLTVWTRWPSKLRSRKIVNSVRVFVLIRTRDPRRFTHITVRRVSLPLSAYLRFSHVSLLAHRSVECIGSWLFSKLEGPAEILAACEQAWIQASWLRASESRLALPGSTTHKNIWRRVQTTKCAYN